MEMPEELLNKLKTLISNMFKDEITVKKCKNHISCWFNNVVLFNICPRKNYYRIEVKVFEGTYTQKLNVHKISSLDEITSLKDEISATVEFLKNQPDDELFACCSRYAECSDVLQCVNPHENLRRNCIYKNNLDKGIVFYGKNKNS